MSLHDLIRNASLEDLRRSIATGSDVNAQDKLKRTPLHIAAWCGNLEAIQLLIRSNASLEIKAMDGFTPLHFLAQSNTPGTAACIKYLVRKGKFLLNSRITKGNRSALHLAAQKGNSVAVRALLELNADTTAKTTSGQTPSDLAKTDEIRRMLADHLDSKLFESDVGRNDDNDADTDKGNQPEAEKASAAGIVAHGAHNALSISCADSASRASHAASEVTTSTVGTSTPFPVNTVSTTDISSTNESEGGVVLKKRIHSEIH